MSISLGVCCWVSVTSQNQVGLYLVLISDAVFAELLDKGYKSSRLCSFLDSFSSLQGKDLILIPSSIGERLRIITQSPCPITLPHRSAYCKPSLSGNSIDTSRQKVHLADTHHKPLANKSRSRYFENQSHTHTMTYTAKRYETLKRLGIEQLPPLHACSSNESDTSDNTFAIINPLTSTMPIRERPVSRVSFPDSITVR